jgi:threonine dehydratase
MVSALTKSERSRGLVTASSGNHGTALSYAASIFETPPTRVYLPKTADPKKVEKIRSYGAEPVLHGENYLEALDEAQRFAIETNSTYVHSHSHPLVIAGQGTIGLEIVEDLSDLDTVLVQVGGGGLISGISTAVKTVNNQVKIIGVEPTAAPGAYQSFTDGYCHERIEIKPSIADGLLGTLTPLTFEISKRYVEDVLLVEDNEIINAMKTLQSAEQLMVEGSAAAGLAAILANKIQIKDEKVVIILTGRNIDSKRYNLLVNT